MARLVFVGLLTLLALGTAGACRPRVATTPAQPAVPQSLDPLSSEEKATAEKLARADARSQELLGSQAVLAAIEFLAVKGEGDEAIRHADLLFSRRDAAFGARAIVRLGATPAVVEFSQIDSRNVPMIEADVQEAWKVALADAGFRKLLSRDPSRLKVEALRIYTERREDPCFAGRCFYLVVRDGDFYISAASVTVDLATRRILSEGSPR